MTDNHLKKLKVCILAYDGLCTFEFGLCVEVFGLERPELEVPWYNLDVVSIDHGLIKAAGGISFMASTDLSLLESADLVMLPGWRGIHDPVPDKLCQSLQTAVSKGARIASICSGVFILAAAGLLTGKRATTHWRYIDQLKSKFSDIDVQENVLYVGDGNILSSAGSAAGLDLCLHIVRQDYGAEIANSVARRLVLPAHRDGGQAQYVPRPVVANTHSDIAPLLDILQRRLDEDWTVERMAGAANTSPRTLQRRFKETTGQSPQMWLTKQRIAFARDLLETTKLTIDEIAYKVGIGSPESLRHHFRRDMGIPPSAYRRSFSATI